MKQLLLRNATLVLALSFLMTSCDKLKDAVKVNVAMQTADVDFTIPIQPAGTQTLSEFVTVLNVDSAIKANNSSFGASNIKSVKVKSCRIIVLNGDAENQLGVLSAAKMEFASNNKPATVTLANLSNNPDAQATSLELPVDSNLELKEYFNATSFLYHLSGTTRRATTKALQCRATVKFDVQVGL